MDYLLILQKKEAAEYQKPKITEDWRYLQMIHNN